MVLEGVAHTFSNHCNVSSGRADAPPPPPLDAVTFARLRLGFEPDAEQARVLASTAKRGILNCSRQWGKSTVAAAKAVHRAYTRPGSLVLVARPASGRAGSFCGRRGRCCRGWGSGRAGMAITDLAAVSERVADCGAARGGGDGARVFGGVAAADRRGVAGAGRDV